MRFPVLPALCAGCLLAAPAVAQTNDSAPPQPPPPTQTRPEAPPPGGPLTRAQVRAALAQARADGSIPRYGNPPGR